MHDVAARERDAQAVHLVHLGHLAQLGEERRELSSPRGELPQQPAAPGRLELLQPVTRGVAGRQARPELRERRPALGGHGEQGQDRQQGVPGRERRESARVLARDALHRAPEQEAAVRLVPDHRRICATRRVGHRREDVRRADPGAEHLGEDAPALDGRVAAHGRHDRPRPDEAGAQHADQVSPQPGARLVGDERPVGVAVGRDDGVEPMRLDPGLRLTLVGIAHRLGVHRHERVGPTERHDLRPERPEEVPADVARNARVLVDADAPPAQDAGWKEAQVPLAVQLQRGGVGVGQRRRGPQHPALERRLVQLDRRVRDGGLVVLQDLARARVELDPVPVERDVAARDHDGGKAPLDGEVRHGRRRQRSAQDDPRPLRRARREARRRHAGAARAEVVADRDGPAAGGRRAAPVQHVQEGRRVGEADLVRERLDGGADAARAEPDAALREDLDANLGGQYVSAVRVRPRS